VLAKLQETEEYQNSACKARGHIGNIRRVHAKLEEKEGISD
jgi:hypothetical protein